MLFGSPVAAVISYNSSLCFSCDTIEIPKLNFQCISIIICVLYIPFFRYNLRFFVRFVFRNSLVSRSQKNDDEKIVGVIFTSHYCTFLCIFITFCCFSCGIKYNLFRFLTRKKNDLRPGSLHTTSFILYFFSYSLFIVVLSRVFFNSFFPVFSQITCVCLVQRSLLTPL